MRKFLLIIVFVVLGLFASTKESYASWSVATCSGTDKSAGAYWKNSCDCSFYDGGCNSTTGHKQNCCSSSCAVRTHWTMCNWESTAWYCNAGQYHCYGQRELLGSGYCYDLATTCSTCKQHDCDGCTPTTPIGYTATNNGCSITKEASCTGTKGCSVSCTLKDTFYFIETNLTKPETPASIKMTVNVLSNGVWVGKVYNLSTDPANPTLIPFPVGASPVVKVTLPTLAVPATASGVGYKFIANNYGLNNIWKTWVSCSGTAGEDFCIENTTATQNFDPTTLSIPVVLKEATAGKIAGLYYTVNKCNTGKLYSLPIEGYYEVQQNVAPPTPASITMTVNAKVYTLSTDSANPTKIPVPIGATPIVKVGLPVISAPATSNGVGYKFIGENYGVNNEWRGWVSCSGTAGEDFCIESTASTQDFDPTTLSIPAVLKENANGRIIGSYYTVNKSDTGKKYSVVPITGYYDINDIPADPSNILPEIGVDVSTKGCSSLTYSGKEVNNPLHFVIKTTDKDGADDIQGTIVWLNKTGTVFSSFLTLTNTYTGSNTGKIGLLILKNGSNWTNPKSYASNEDTTFGLVTNSYLKNSSNVNTIKISNLTVTQTVNDVTFDFNVEFLDTTAQLSGMYELSSTVLDKSLINVNTVDQSNLKVIRNWGIDLQNPTIVKLTSTLKDQNNLYIDWSASDATTPTLNMVIMNVYRDESTSSDVLQLYLPALYTTRKNIVNGATSLTPISLQNLSEGNIGRYDDQNAWAFTNLNAQKDLLNIGNNEGGKITTYVTAYDQACNTSGESNITNLNPWIATKGGSIYSEGSITSNNKDVSTITALDGILKTTTKDKIDLGSELLASRSDTISSLIHPEYLAVRATRTYDSNSRKTYWYSYLEDKFLGLKENNTAFTDAVLGTKVSDDCTGTNCYLYSENDINIPSGYVCDKKALFITKGSINIEPNITNFKTGTVDNLGCIFLAKQGINIKAGTYQSQGFANVHYDYIDGFMITNGIINIENADTAQVVRDGVEINGGLIAFGSYSTSSPAISILRNLKLYNITNPTLVLNYDPRYPRIAEIFFGTDSPIYKQEIGFKTF